jgi:hypothetical protein
MQYEAILQQECVHWFYEYTSYTKHNALLHHSANSTSGGSSWIFRNKRQGVYFGYPDLTLHLPNGKTVFFELKSLKGRVSANQKQCHQKLESLGFNMHIVRSIKEFQDLIVKELGATVCN